MLAIGAKPKVVGSNPRGREKNFFLSLRAFTSQTASSLKINCVPVQKYIYNNILKDIKCCLFITQTQVQADIFIDKIKYEICTIFYRLTLNQGGAAIMFAKILSQY